MRLTRSSFSDLVAAGLRNLRDDRRGTIAVTVALSATVLFGFAGLAIEVASWQVAQLSMQGTADAAAYSAGVAFNKIPHQDPQLQAQGIASQQGYAGQCPPSGATVSVCVNRPPKSGPTTGIYATAIEVIIQQPQPQFFSGLFLSSNPTVSARAVAAVFPPCILALSPNANPGITVSGGQTNVNTPACTIVSDSNSTSGNGATNISGGATVTTPCLVSVGADVITGGSTLNLTQCTTATNGAAPVPDPFGCSGGSCVPDPPPIPNNQINNCNAPPSGYIPGDYTCDPNPNSSVTFNPGLYYFEKGFSVGGGATATGTGVTFYIATGKTAAVSGNATVNFSAPTAATCISSTCPYVGIVYLGSRTSNGQNNNFDNSTGGNTSAITGVIYFPSDQVSFSGGSTTLYNACTQIVASTITVSGQAQLNNSCNFIPGTVQLVE